MVICFFYFEVIGRLFILFFLLEIYCYEKVDSFYGEVEILLGIFGFKVEWEGFWCLGDNKKFLIECFIFFC